MCLRDPVIDAAPPPFRALRCRVRRALDLRSAGELGSGAISPAPAVARALVAVGDDNFGLSVIDRETQSFTVNSNYCRSHFFFESKH